MFGTAPSPRNYVYGHTEIQKKKRLRGNLHTRIWMVIWWEPHHRCSWNMHPCAWDYSNESKKKGFWTNNCDRSRLLQVINTKVLYIFRATRRSCVAVWASTYEYYGGRQREIIIYEIEKFVWIKRRRHMSFNKLSRFFCFLLCFGLTIAT